MNTDKREEIQSTLRTIASHHAAQMKLMEQLLSLLCDEAALDPLTYFHTHTSRNDHDQLPGLTDRSMLSVTFRGKTCFLGNTLPFRLLSRLAERPNAYVTYEDLLSDVWHGNRSDSTVRSAVKSLRNKLRQAGLAELADAIDGTVPGHYALKVAA